MTLAVKLEKVAAGYEEAVILKDLTLSIAEGEMVALLGPNGAGKSTVFRVLTGLIRQKEGIVRLFDRDVRTLPAEDRARLVAVVPQELELPMPFTVEEIVMMGRTASLSRWTRPSEEDRRVVERAMVYTDVIDFKERPMSALSGGEKQRVLVAMALAQEPRLILMDEPTSHLDINHRLEIMQLVEKLNARQGVTIWMTSHDLNLAAEFFGRLMILDHGRLVANGRPAEVLREDVLRDVYHCDMHVQTDGPGGAVAVFPSRRLKTLPDAGNVRVHVIAGGGSGEALMRRLCLCGYRVTCGVLNQGDSDAQAAVALELESALEKPFAPIGASMLERGKTLAKSAEAVILCEVPFGPGNLVNIELVEEAQKDQRPVFINIRQLEQRDFTDSRQAVARLKALLSRGAVPWQNINEVTQRLSRAIP